MSSLNIKTYRERMEAYKKVGSDGQISKMQNAILNSFYVSPSYFRVMVNFEKKDVHIVEGFKENSLIMMKPNEPISAGSLVDWQGRQYMVVLVYDNKTIQYKGVLERCNETLTWQDDLGVLHSMPCMVEDKTSVYSDGLSKTKYLTIGLDQISIVVQENKATRDIPLNKRFIFSQDKNNIYEVVRSDNMLNEGLVTFVCKKSLYNEYTDNLELNLANYNGAKDPEPDAPVIPVGLEIEGLDRLTIWDENIQYSTNTDKPVKWSLITEDTLKIVKELNNKCYISPIHTTKIGKSTLRVELIEDSKIFAEKEINLFYQ